MSQGEEVPIEEACAMTTRVSPSFIRIGHFDLFGRLLDTPVDDVRFYSCITAFFHIGCPQICLFTAFFSFSFDRRARHARTPEAKASAVEELRLM